MAQAAARDQLSVDKDGIRLIPADKLEQATSLQEDCHEFASKTTRFNDTVAEFVRVLEAKQAIVDAAKLRAIGLGNKVLGEAEVRKRKQRYLQATLNERRAELERLTVQHESLSRVIQDQQALIERLQNNEA